VLTLFTGLSSALTYATSDMLSQGVTRVTRPLTQLSWVLTTGTVIIVPVALVVDGLPQGDEWQGAGLAILAGVFYFGAFYLFLRGLMVGDLGLVSALTALQGAYLAVIVILLGAPMSPLLGVALALCAIGAVLASMEGRAKSSRGAAWALAAGACFTGVMLCYGYGDSLGWLSQTAISRFSSLAITLPAALLSGGIAVPAKYRPRALAAGVLELCGLILLTVAFSLGPLTVAGVTTTQFGTFGVLLGFVVLRERPRPNQWAGIVCALAGVSLLTVVA